VTFALRLKTFLCDITKEEKMRAQKLANQIRLIADAMEVRASAV